MLASSRQTRELDSTANSREHLTPGDRLEADLLRCTDGTPDDWARIVVEHFRDPDPISKYALGNHFALLVWKYGRQVAFERIRQVNRVMINAASEMYPDLPPYRAFD